MPSAISWSAASQNSNNSAASQPVSKRQPEITLPSSLSQPSSYGCDKCPHHLGLLMACGHFPRRPRAILDSASDSFCTGSHIAAMLKAGSLQRPNPADSSTLQNHHQSPPFTSL